MAHTIFLPPPPHPSTLMEPYTYKRVLLSDNVTSRLLQTRKRLKKFLERPKLWMSSVFHTQMLVDPHLKVNDASSGSAESIRSVLDSLMTRHDSITCQSTSADNLNLPLLGLLLSDSSPNSHCPVQDDGDRHRYGIIAEGAFSDDNELELLVPEDDHTELQYHLSNASEEPKLATVLSWSNDTAPPPLTIWHQSAEPVASSDCIDKVQTENPNLFVNMLCGISSVVIDTSEAEDSSQDNRDTGLRVVITPPDDNWETSTSTAHNRIGPQYLACLVVPPFYQSTSRLIKYEEWMAIYHPPAGTFSHDQLEATSGRASAGPLVFSPTAFQERLQDTENDRFNYCNVVTALQRHQLKAAAFTASIKARLFRMRYDTPEFLENIEPPFKWIDPAEILIESFRNAPQSVTICTSPRPCSVPHIAIHESPPNDPYVVWSNSTDSQNYCFLTISSPNPSLWGKDDCQMADYCFTDDSSSLCVSSAPITPKDFSSTLEEDVDILFSGDTGESQHSDHISQQYENEFVAPHYPSRYSSDTTRPSKSKFFIPDDEEEDDLPPLDDWYIAIANRCMAPEEAKAVAAAAAMSAVSCH